MSTIYRGYEIKPEPDGSFGIHSGGPHPVVTETFKSEEEAMDYIDRQRRRNAASSD